MNKKTHELSRFLDKMNKSGSDYSFAKVLNQVYLCSESGLPKFSEFLNPQRLQYMQTSLTGLEKFGIIMTVNGGHPHAERNMLGFASENIEPSDFPITKILIEYEVKHAKPEHSDFLGAILGLGLDRSVIGDIVLLPDSAVIMAESRIEDFLLSSLCKVGKTSVSVSLLSDDVHIYGLDNRVKDRLICASLKLDSLLASAFKLSRGDAAALVRSGKAFVNWQEVSSPAKTVKDGDMLTLRKHGRVRILEVVGKSRKDHFLIDIIRF